MEDRREQSSREGKSKRAKVTKDEEEQDDSNTVGVDSGAKSDQYADGGAEGQDPVNEAVAPAINKPVGETFEESAEGVDLENIGANRTLLATVSSKGINLEVSVS